MGKIVKYTILRFAGELYLTTFSSIEVNPEFTIDNVYRSLRSESADFTIPSSFSTRGARPRGNEVLSDTTFSPRCKTMF